jgi:hypothetical protein
MAKVRAFREYGHPLLLIAVWSLLEAATIAWTALVPGAPFYSNSGIGSLGQSVFFTAVLVVFVSVGSRLAWWLAIFSTTVGVSLGVVGGLIEFGAKPVGFVLLQALALWLIWSGNIELYVQSNKRRRRMVTPPATR